jgi:hypothetical protein
MRTTIPSWTVLTVAVGVLAAAGSAAAATPALHTGTAYPVAPFDVKGTIGLAENTASHTLTIRLDLTGFKPDSRHIMHVHKGLTCAAMVKSAMPSPTMGPIIVPLGVHTADGKGDMKTTFTVKNAPTVDFGQIHVMVHYGPNISTESSARPVTCADIP